MTLTARLKDDMKSAMRAGDKARLATVRLALAAIKQREVDTRTELDDAAVEVVIEKLIKQGQDSAAQFKSGGREDLAAKELAEIALLETYLPEALDADALDALIAGAIVSTDASSAQDMGRVMAKIKADATGRIDMRAVSAKVRAALAGD